MNTFLVDIVLAWRAPKENASLQSAATVTVFLELLALLPIDFAFMRSLRHAGSTVRRISHRLGVKHTLFGPQLQLRGQFLHIAVVKPRGQALRGGEQVDISGILSLTLRFVFLSHRAASTDLPPSFSGLGSRIGWRSGTEPDVVGGSRAKPDPLVANMANAGTVFRNAPRFIFLLGFVSRPGRSYDRVPASQTILDFFFLQLPRSDQLAYGGIAVGPPSL